MYKDNKKYNLTKEKAIKWHRKMWNWIADFLEDNDEYVWELKEKFLKMHGFNDVKHECFCCEYANQQAEKEYEIKETRTKMCHYCPYCPLQWGTENNANDYFCENGIQTEIEKFKSVGLWTIILIGNLNHKENAKIARKIANLPEK